MPLIDPYKLTLDLIQVFADPDLVRAEGLEITQPSQTRITWQGRHPEHGPVLITLYHDDPDYARIDINTPDLGNVIIHASRTGSQIETAYDVRGDQNLEPLLRPALLAAGDLA